MQNEQGECTMQPIDDIAQRKGEVVSLLVFTTHKQCGDFGVRLAGEDGIGMSCHKLGFELGKVLDDAVVDERELTVVAQMRMRVLVVGAAVGRPAGMPDSRRTVRQLAAVEIVDEHLQLAGPLASVQHALGVDHRDTGRVVATVFEPT